MLSDVALTNVSDHAVWNEPTISPYPIFVTADFVWNFAAGETHFSKHYFTVDVWQYDQKKKLYTRVTSYRTARRYDGGDSVGTVSVISPERAEILRHLAALNPNH